MSPDQDARTSVSPATIFGARWTNPAKPWVAKIVFALSGLGCCFLGLSTLIVLAAGCDIAQWVLLNVAGIVGRVRGLTGGPARIARRCSR